MTPTPSSSKPARHWLAAAAILASAILAWTVLRISGGALGAPHWALAIAYCAAGLTIAWLFERDRSSWSALDSAKVRKAAAAFLAAFCLVGVLALAGLAFGVLIGDYRIDVVPLTSAGLVTALTVAVVVLLGEAISEEFVFRHALLNRLRAVMGVWPALGLQAVAFMVWAFVFVTLIGLFGIASDWTIGWDRVLLFLSFGLALGLARELTGSIWAAVGLHLAFQTAAQLTAAGAFPALRIDPASQTEMGIINIWLFAVALTAVAGALALLLIRRGRSDLEPSI